MIIIKKYDLESMQFKKSRVKKNKWLSQELKMIKNTKNKISSNMNYKNKTLWLSLNLNNPN